MFFQSCSRMNKYSYIKRELALTQQLALVSEREMYVGCGVIL
jgi:hypothetical protein